MLTNFFNLQKEGNNSPVPEESSLLTKPTTEQSATEAERGEASPPRQVCAFNTSQKVALTFLALMLLSTVAAMLMSWFISSEANSNAPTNTTSLPPPSPFGM